MISSFEVTNFTGGLNLVADVYNIGKDETSDIMNMDIDPRGGVSVRSGTRQMNSTAIGSLGALDFIPKKLYQRQNEDQCLMVAANNKVFRCDAGNFVDLGITTDSLWGASFADINDADNITYITSGTGAAYPGYTWDTVAVTALTISGSGQWQDDLLNPVGTHMPQAEHIASHNERLWVAYTKEDGTVHADRVRFSHPLFPKSWRQQDYIDIVGGGDGIRALIPYADHLLVFKPRAVFAIFGYNTDTFQVVPVTRELGVLTPNSVTGSFDGVYFFSFPEGLFFYGGGVLRDKFIKLRPMMVNGDVNSRALDAVNVFRFSNRVFLSLPYLANPETVAEYDDATVDWDDDQINYSGLGTANASTVTFVLDEEASKDGSWTKYQLADGYGFGPGCFYRDDEGVDKLAFCHPLKPYVMTLEPTFYDDEIAGSLESYSSLYRTTWVDAGSSRNKKFWRRPEFVMNHNNSGYTVDVDVYHDWEGLNLNRSFQAEMEAHSYIIPEDSAYKDNRFGSDIVLGGTLGSARSVQLVINGPTGTSWGLNGINYRFSPKGVKI